MPGAISIGAIPSHVSDYFGGEEINKPGALLIVGTEGCIISTSTGDHLIQSAGNDVIAVECWYKYDTGATTWEVIARAVNEFTFQIFNDGVNFNMSIFKHDGAYVEWSHSGSTQIWDNEWHFLYAEIDLLTPHAAMSIDGDTVANDRANPTDTDAITAGGAAFTIGMNEAGTENMRGYIDQLRISNISRYGASAHAVPAGALAVDGNTLALYRFENESPDTAAIDESTSAADVPFHSSAPTWAEGVYRV